MASRKKQMQTALGKLSSMYPSKERPLAEPPAGSGLKPVMGDPGIPYLGNTLQALADPLQSAMDRFERYGQVSWSGALGMNMVTLVGPDAIEAVWMNRNKAFSSELGWEPMIGPFFRRGVMLMDFDEHMQHRRIMQQAFSRPRLNGYLDIMTPHIEKTLANWQVGKGFHMYSNTKDLTLSLATEVFMGAHVSEAEAHRLEKAFEAAVRGGQAMVRKDVGNWTWAQGLRGREVLQEYFRSEIPLRRGSDADDLFTVLCNSESDEGETFTDEDIVNHMIFVMMAAHDTSTIALSMLTYFLGRHPEWQQRLREESLALNKPTIDYDDVDKLPSMELAFKETLRLNAPVGMLFRMAIEDTEICGHYIPKGTLLAIHPWATMLRKEWWPNPTHFDPERFSAERREDKVHRFAWAPFGGGAHKCIGLYFGGMEVKSILHQMLQRFEWTVPAGYKPELTYGTGPTPADGLPIDIRHRAL
ncbi:MULTISPECIES: cytochrome P450 [Gordonia]|uniref:Cytochrome P450 n=2 Tax=Gordonia alkanivorans TaxID=84096 RepID=W9DAV3_9ACTN|nr:MULTISPECIES: cytochrome P450 [Gordonia]ETA06528.1 cytochrome P450 [Gordonia alkanivorans CGMCC 6845]MDH3006726.1 cytochrome P450 [Gordonia alkanivorans]MDH3010041.1 cytochrome P450 [Gordonia alkanivorans]MDH3014485.1 cytochrome P450 [Gordonia alkanivorans]MDH3018408.1 cytochrome P450 [Gordonia alkanivorans]